MTLTEINFLKLSRLTFLFKDLKSTIFLSGFKWLKTSFGEQLSWIFKLTSLCILLKLHPCAFIFLAVAHSPLSLIISVLSTWILTFLKLELLVCVFRLITCKVFKFIRNFYHTLISLDPFSKFHVWAFPYIVADTTPKRVEVASFTAQRAFIWFLFKRGHEHAFFSVEDSLNRAVTVPIFSCIIRNVLTDNLFQTDWVLLILAVKAVSLLLAFAIPMLIIVKHHIAWFRRRLTYFDPQSIPQDS